MILIQNGLVVDPSQHLCEVQDVLIDQGKIMEIGKGLVAPEGAEVIDATDKMVMPGFIDMHVHLREPGLEYKETILSGTQAAAAGGITSVACMPNTNPVIDTETVVESIIFRAQRHGYADVYPTAAITKGQKGTELTEMGMLLEAGAVAFTEDGKTVHSSAVMRNALEYCKMFDGLIISHCEDEELLGSGVMNEGRLSSELGLAGIPNEVEDLIIARDIMLAKLTNSRVHIAHLSTVGGVEMVRQAKAKGIKVTAEVTPHHLVLTEEAVRGYNTDAKVNPPLRTDKDRMALIQALQDGTVDCIATDHAPHSIEEKEVEFAYAANGISGFETAVPVVWTNLVETGLLTPSQLVQVFAINPAKVLKIDKGTLQVGKVADVLVFDPAAKKVVDKEKFYSKGKNTPFHGMELQGWADTVIKSGKVVVVNGEVQ